MILSIRTKEAIKVGLAMAIVYGIALQMDWDRPYWAAFAVAFISLATTGQSLRKGFLRMSGTLVAGVAALTIIALFPQERWWFMATLSVYIGFCTYMMTGSKNPYFYQVSAFVCVIICFDSDAQSLQVFQTAVIRIQETGLGILVYSLVAVFLWPRSTRNELNATSRQLFATQHGVYRSRRALMTSKRFEKDARAEGMQELLLLGQLEQVLEAAVVDSYDVWEVRHQWRRFLRQSTALMQTLGHWRESLPELQSLDLNKLLPNLEAVCTELDMRFAQIERMLGGEAPERSLLSITLAIDKTELAVLPHFDRAALMVTKTYLDHLEALSRSLFHCVQEIKGFSSQPAMPSREKAPDRGLVIDPDRIAAIFKVLATLWLAFLIWVYIDPPGHAGFVIMATSLGLAMAMFPQVRVASLFLPAFLSCVFAGVLYIFVMPYLSGYTQLGLMIFLATFAIAYLFSRPQQAIARAFGLAFFAVITGITNQQAYSFSSFINTTAMVLLVVSLLVVTSYIPFSPQPEKAFLRLLRRFFRHADFLMSQLALEWDQHGEITKRWKTIRYCNDLLKLPEKLGIWGAMIDHRTCPGSSPEQVQRLVTNLRDLALWTKDLTDANECPQAELFVRELRDDVRAWRLGIERLFQDWAINPTVISDRVLRENLEALLAKMETRIDETLRLAEQSKLSNENYENFYRLLGGYRGLSEAVVGHAQLAEGIDWKRWREARF